MFVFVFCLRYLFFCLYLFLFGDGEHHRYLDPESRLPGGSPRPDHRLLVGGSAIPPEFPRPKHGGVIVCFCFVTGIQSPCRVIELNAKVR